ncbi:MAG: hypothetical protein BJ554DRAFT_4518, partial [Olpidium bornovanus]
KKATSLPLFPSSRGARRLVQPSPPSARLRRNPQEPSPPRVDAGFRAEMGAQADNEDPSRGSRIGGSAGGGVNGGDAGPPQRESFASADVSVFSDTQGTNLSRREFGLTGLTILLITATVVVAGASKSLASSVCSYEFCWDAERYRTPRLADAESPLPIFSQGKDNFRTRALKLPEKKLTKKPKAAKPKEAQAKLPGDSDEEDTKWSEEPQPQEMSLFCLDRRIRNLADIVNNYGPEHLPPVVPGAVDKLRDLRAETGVEIEIDRDDPRVWKPLGATVSNTVATEGLLSSAT